MARRGSVPKPNAAWPVNRREVPDRSTKTYDVALILGRVQGPSHSRRYPPWWFHGVAYGGRRRSVPERSGAWLVGGRRLSGVGHSVGT